MGNASVTNTLKDPRSGFVGALVDTSGPGKTESAINSGGQSVQTARLTLDNTTTAGTVHSVSFTIAAMGIVAQVVAVTANGTDTVDQIATKLAAKINATPAVASSVAAVATGSGGIINLSGRFYTSIFEVLNVSNAPVSLNVAANSAAIIYPGRAIAWTGDGAEQANVSAMSTAIYSAQVDTVDITFEGGSFLHWSIVVDGKTYSDVVTMATNAATTGGLVVAQVNAALPADTVVATAPGDNFVLTSEVAGKPFETTTYLTNQTTGALVFGSTASLGTDAIRSFWGAALKSSSIRGPSAGDSTEYYRSNDIVRVARQAPLWVEGTGIGRLDPVYLELSPGDNAGKFYNASGSNRILLPREIAKWGVQGDTVTALHLSL